MSALTLTFSGSYLELIGWVLLLAFWTATAFFFGWLHRDMREDDDWTEGDDDWLTRVEFKPAPPDDTDW